MKHIKDIIAEKQLSLFAHKSQKGSAEWSAFNSIRGDHAGAYRVITPRAEETPRYPNVVHITRYPRHLTPKFSH